MQSQLEKGGSLLSLLSEVMKIDPLSSPDLYCSKCKKLNSSFTFSKAWVSHLSEYQPPLEDMLTLAGPESANLSFKRSRVGLENSYS